MEPPLGVKYYKYILPAECHGEQAAILKSHYKKVPELIHHLELRVQVCVDHHIPPILCLSGTSDYF